MALNKPGNKPRQAETKAPETPPASEREAGMQAHNDAVAADQAARAEAEEKASAKAVKDSGVKLRKYDDVKPGKYQTTRVKMIDPDTNLLFYPDRPTTVSAVTGWVAAQVRAGVLVRCKEAVKPAE